MRRLLLAVPGAPDSVLLQVSCPLMASKFTSLTLEQLEENAKRETERERERDK